MFQTTEMINYSQTPVSTHRYIALFFLSDLQLLAFTRSYACSLVINARFLWNKQKRKILYIDQIKVIKIRPLKLLYSSNRPKATNKQNALIQQKKMTGKSAELQPKAITKMWRIDLVLMVVVVVAAALIFFFSFDWIMSIRRIDTLLFGARDRKQCRWQIHVLYIHKVICVFTLVLLSVILLFHAIFIFINAFWPQKTHKIFIWNKERKFHLIEIHFDRFGRECARAHGCVKFVPGKFSSTVIEMSES